MKVAFVLCLLALHGCNDVTHPKPVVLADGRWAEVIQYKAEECAMMAMIKGADTLEIEALFNKCVFERGLTI